MVAEYDNSQFCAKWVQHFVFLDEEDTHGGDRTWDTFCAKGAVLCKVDLDVCVLGLNSGFLLAKTCHPCVTIRVGGVEASEKGVWALTLEVHHANVGCGCHDVWWKARTLE